MLDPARGPLRAARAGAVGASVAVISVGSHAAVSGHGSSWLAVVPTAAAVALAAWLLGDRRLGRVTLVALLGGAQVGIHALSSHLAMHPMMHDLPMVGAHVAAAALCGLLLAHGDRLIWLIRAWRTPLELRRRAVRPVVGAMAARPVTRVVVPFFDAGAISRRGPPLPVL